MTANAIFCASDFERAAEAALSPDLFAYLSGGSGHEATLISNRHAFESLKILPKAFRDTSKSPLADSLKLTLPDGTHGSPLFLAPVAHQKLVHPEAEIETARAAEATDTTLIASHLSSFSLEAISKASRGPKWFQLYWQQDRDINLELISKARDHHYRALVLTLDAGIQLPSLRALRSGFVFPDHCTPGNRITTTVAEETTSTNLKQAKKDPSSLRISEPSRDDIKWLVNSSPLPVFIKGILNPDDALKARELGAAGLIISNHGGRTVDGVPASLTMLPIIRKVIGSDYPLLLDSGVRSGFDAFKAMAMGANAVLIGRLQMYALAYQGALGVGRLMRLLTEEFTIAMAVTGCSQIADIHPGNLFSTVSPSC
jgi:isopentenyl diphosphate isomerase/L-lactate dehydrogenase-like FMN-dependent dehydrogenase